MPNCCCLCGLMKKKNPQISLHRFPTAPKLRRKWLASLNLQEDAITSDSRVCSLHFRDGNINTIPSLSIGPKFSEQPDSSTPRAKRLSHRASPEDCRPSKRQRTPITPPSTGIIPQRSPPSEFASPCESMSSVCEPEGSDVSAIINSDSMESAGTQQVQVTVNAALASQIDLLATENTMIKAELAISKKVLFRIENIANNSLLAVYTGFTSYEVFAAFFAFLGPSTNFLNYWGTTGKGERYRKTKLDLVNQLFLTLIKLRLDPPFSDLAYRFQISEATASRYFTTWVCLMYHHLSEIDWFPNKEQILLTLPSAFREKYPTTVAILDASEVFIETPSDLMLQSSSWSSYKHHNTIKFLVVCTPNGAISYISPAYLGSVSDPALTEDCGFLSKLNGVNGMSVMADRGFTISQSLRKVGVQLNLPPFMEGRKQLPAEEVQIGRTIASLRIHVERAIGRMKLFKILKGVFPLKMSRIANQIVTVCALLTNFQSALVPVASYEAETDNPENSDNDSDEE